MCSLIEQLEKGALSHVDMVMGHYICEMEFQDILWLIIKTVQRLFKY